MVGMALIGSCWLSVVRSNASASIGRVLADDLLVYTETDLGEEAAVADHSLVIEATCEFVNTLQAVLSVDKSHTAANTAEARARMKRLRFDGSPIPVLASYRDLGSHLNATRRFVAPTLTTRLTAGVEACKAVASLP
eukprot:13221486-Alexandrium_andersonii.AAC.1